MSGFGESNDARALASEVEGKGLGKAVDCQWATRYNHSEKKKPPEGGFLLVAKAVWA